MWQPHKTTYFVTNSDGTVLIDGIGYCFPDRSEAKPEPRTYILVTEVNAVEKNGKKFGFYKWKPTEKNKLTEEDLISRYLLHPKPEFLLSPIWVLHLPEGDAIVLRNLESARQRDFWAYRGLSLNGWAENAVSVTSADIKYVKNWGNPTPYFEEKKTMLDLLLEHGYGNVSPDEIFDAIQKVMDPSNALFEVVPWGNLVRGKYNGKEIVCVGYYFGTIRQYLPVLKGLPVMMTEDLLPQEKVDLCEVASFVTYSVKEKYGLAADEELFKTAPLNLPPMDKKVLEKKDQFAKLPPAVRMGLEKNFFSANIIYPDHWMFNVPDDYMPIQLTRIAACLTKEDLLAICEFVNEQNEKAAQVVAFREVALDRLEPLNFAYIRGEQECAFEHSELLDDALDNGLGKEACWNNIEYIKTDDGFGSEARRAALIARYTEEELLLIVKEVNAINREAENRIRSAIAKGRLPMSAVVTRRV